MKINATKPATVRLSRMDDDKWSARVGGEDIVVTRECERGPNCPALYVARTEEGHGPVVTHGTTRAQVRRRLAALGAPMATTIRGRDEILAAMQTEGKPIDEGELFAEIAAARGGGCEVADVIAELATDLCGLVAAGKVVALAVIDKTPVYGLPGSRIEDWPHFRAHKRS